VGVFRIVNGKTRRILLGSSTNLPAVGNKLAFAKSTNLPGALDQQIRRDVAVFCHSDEASSVPREGKDSSFLGMTRRWRRDPV
jgi:hypothetical protein